MGGTGSMSELERRLRAKAEEDRRRSERIYLGELRTLGKNLRRCVRKDASSIERVMERLNASARVILRRLALLGVGLGLSVSLGIFGGNWALQGWLSSRVQSLRAEQVRLETEIADQRLTLQRLNEKTWGVQLVQDSQGPLVVLPKGTIPNPKWTLGGLPAIPLPSK